MTLIVDCMSKFNLNGNIFIDFLKSLRLDVLLLKETNVKTQYVN